MIKKKVRLTPKGVLLLDALLPRMRRIQDQFCDAQLGIAQRGGTTVTGARPKLSIGDVLEQALASLTRRLDDIEPQLLQTFCDLG